MDPGPSALLPRLLRSTERLLDSLFSPRPLNADDLIRLAQARTGLTDFGEWNFREPLEVLVRAYETEARLTPFGRIAARWDMTRFLSNLLRLRRQEADDPAIRAEPITRPIFILGLPRSGTTFLHSLLGQDRANRAPLAWQTIYPYPTSANSILKRDRRPRKVARQFRSFLRIAPNLRSLHPLEADAPQECIEITGQVIRSLRFDTTHYVPSYARWLDAAGHREAYLFHKRFLQHLQRQSGPGRWVLKSPDHIYAFEALQEVYPDARFVFVHRDPLEVLASVARLTEVLREPFAWSVDRHQIGRQVSERWEYGARLLIEASVRLRATPERIVHLRHRNLVSDPVAAVAAVYRHFGLEFTADAVRSIERFLAMRSKGGYGHNVYRLEDYGLRPDQERRRYREYMSYFRLGSEKIAELSSRRDDVQIRAREASPS